LALFPSVEIQSRPLAVDGSSYRACRTSRSSWLRGEPWRTDRRDGRISAPHQKLPDEGLSGMVRVPPGIISTMWPKALLARGVGGIDLHPHAAGVW
jgi:hypothetical protein